MANNGCKPFRLRCKVLEHEGRMYLIALGLNLPPAPGEEIRITAYGMSDDETITVNMSVEEWNSLKWHWFVSEGESPRRPHAPVKPVPLGDIQWTAKA
ncbi:MAG TPA: hypothetical protein VFV82_06180 [Candidatus Binatia bacterium]|nr:hypothetical protein [Candidatus Binatia bacterium]